MMTYGKHYDRYVGIILLVTVVVLFADTFSFKTRPLVPLNTAFWPRVILSLMAVVSLILIFKGRVTEESPEAFKWQAGVVMAGSTFYVLILPIGGFFLASTFIAASGYFWLSKTKTLRTLTIAILYGIGVSGIVFGLFKLALRVQLPEAAWS